MVKFYQQFSNDKKLNRRKLIAIIHLIINGLFILILLNDNTTFAKNKSFDLIEGMKKKQMEILWIKLNRKKIYWILYFHIYIR